MSLRNQVSINLAFAFVKSLLLALSVSVADKFLPAQVMGFILLFRRQGALIGTFVQFGLSQSIRNFYIKEADQEIRKKNWNIQIKLGLVFSLIFLVLSLLVSDALPSIFLGKTGLLVSASFGLYVTGMAIGYMAASSWSSDFKFAQYNIIDLLNGSLLMIFCILIYDFIGFQSFILLFGAITLVSSLLSLCYFSLKTGNYDSQYNQNWSLDKTIIRYGLTRWLISFLDLATVTVGPWMLRTEQDQAGYLIIAYTFMRLSQAIIMPISQVLALRANSYLHDVAREEKRILWLTVLSAIGGLVIVSAYYFYGEELFTLWLPNSHLNVIFFLDRLIIFTPVLCVFYCLRNHIEIRITAPLNLYAFLSGLLSFFVGIYIHGGSSVDAIIFGSQLMFSAMFLYSLLYVYLLLKKFSQC